MSTGPCMQYLVPTALHVEYIFTIVIGTNFLTMKLLLACQKLYDFSTISDLIHARQGRRQW